MWPVLLFSWMSTGEAGERARNAALDAVSGQAPDRMEAQDVAERLAAGLPGQVATAAAVHPEVRAAFAHWHARALSVSAAGTLPDPSLEFSLFLRALETRTGPQQGRVGVRQALPWPTVLTAGTDAAAESSRAAGARFEARILDVALAVEDAHWTLWSVREMRSIHKDHHALVEGLSGTVRGRVEVGSASLSDLQQVDLEHARLMDDIARMDEQERSAEAMLRAAVGVWSSDSLATPDAPGGPYLPDEASMVLEAAATAHPLLQERRHQVAAADAAVRVARGQRLPGLTVGVDWMVIGASDAASADPDAGGQDAVAAGVGLSVPIWQKRAADRVSAARAMAQSARAEVEIQELSARASLHDAMATVEASGRRVATIRGTLLPQAEAAYSSLLGTYTAGTSSVAQLLMAQQVLLELRLDLVGAEAGHAQAWAMLRAVCGRDIQTRRLVPARVE